MDVISLALFFLERRKFEDATGEIRSRILERDRQHNGQLILVVRVFVVGNPLYLNSWLFVHFVLLLGNVDRIITEFGYSVLFKHPYTSNEHFQYYLLRTEILSSFFQ